ncbi:MAG: multicopper oxidase family protein [Patescibacteria group bacterium]
MNTLSKNQLIGIGVLVVLVISGWLLMRRGQPLSQQLQQAVQKSGTFSTATRGLLEAKPASTVELKDGDTYDLEASIVQKSINGQRVKMLAYNGSIPGPLIKVKQGSEVTINFTNNTDVETTIHSHGVRVANEFDGTPDLTQEPVPVGGTFTYKLKFPDAGMFWYHPHVREDYAQESGLYGNFLVIPTDTEYWSPVNREEALMVDDILLENGKLATFSTTTADRTLMGRFGNVMLINGETGYNLAAKQGEVVRFYLTNVASTRTFNVSIPNAKMKLVGADGGKYEQETFVDSVIISPSERAIIEVLFDSAGTYALQHTTPEKTYTLGTVSVSSDKAAPSYLSQFNMLHTNQDIIASIDPFRSAFAKAADKKLTLTIDMMGMGNMSGMGNGGHMMPDGSMMGGMMMGGDNDPIEWEDDMAMMNAMSTTQNLTWKMLDQASKQANMDIGWKFKVGDKVRVSIFNDPRSAHPMQHPIHFHGQRFLVLSTNGVKNDNLAWKDTVLVKNGDTVEILVDMSNPGDWMAHCHISEHLEDGMMFTYTIES